MINLWAGSSTVFLTWHSKTSSLLGCVGLLPMRVPCSWHSKIQWSACKFPRKNPPTIARAHVSWHLQHLQGLCEPNDHKLTPRGKMFDALMPPILQVVQGFCDACPRKLLTSTKQEYVCVWRSILGVHGRRGSPFPLCGFQRWPNPGLRTPWRTKGTTNGASEQQWAAKTRVKMFRLSRATRG